MKKIYRIGENIIEELEKYDKEGIKQESKIYRVVSIEGIFSDEGALNDRKVAITDIDTGKVDFWVMILDMMKKQGHLLKSSSESLQKDIKERFGNVG